MTEIRQKELYDLSSVSCRTPTATKTGVPARSRKELEPIMKNTKKSFSQSLRSQLREGFILYAAANNCFPMNVEMLQLYSQTIDEEMN